MSAFAIRKGREADIDALLEIERRAATLLLDHGAFDVFAMHSLSPADLLKGIQSGSLHVAEIGSEPVGFVLSGALDGRAHLFEMDVDPAHGRRGIGSALLEAACETSALHGLRAMTLTTLRDVAWNAPFYARRGFVECAEAEWGPELRGIVDRERMLGFPMELRVVMRRML